MVIGEIIAHAVVESPSARKAVLLPKMELPAVDALVLVSIEVELARRQRADEMLCGRCIIIGVFHVDLRACRQLVVEHHVVHGLSRPISIGRHHVTRHVLACVFRVVVTGVTQAQPMIVGKGIVKSHTPQMLVIAAALRFVRLNVVCRPVVKMVKRGLVSCSVGLAMIVLIVHAEVEFSFMIDQSCLFAPHRLVLLVPGSREFSLPSVRLRTIRGDVEVDARPTHLVAGWCGVHHFGMLQSVSGKTLQQGIELSGIHLIVLAVDQYVEGIA